MIIDQTVRNMGRVQEISAILTKYGFEEFVNATPIKIVIPNKSRLSWKREKEKKKYNRWELMRMAAEDLGPTYIKLAQSLSNRPDILPDALIKELQKLQSEVYPLPFDQIKELVTFECGKDIDQIFARLDEKPLGSASIGQVHRAKLLNGKEVVIKIQRPGVRKKVETDLDILKTLVRWGKQTLENQGVFGLTEIIEAFERSILRELDYNTEARFMEQFAAYYKKNKKFRVPKVYKEYTTSKMLVQDFVDGAKITDLEQLEKWGVNTDKVVAKGVDIYLSQIFEHGYFHADPHPGNILIQKDGTICLIDFGMVGRLSKRDRFTFARVLIGMARQDATMMAKNFKRLALDSDIEDDRAFEMEIENLIEDYGSLNVSELDVGAITMSLQEIIRTHKMKMPGGVFIVMRALGILDGIGKIVAPDFQTYEAFKPYGFKILKQMYSPENLAEDAWQNANDFYQFVTSFPTDVKEILEKTRKGQLKIEHKNSWDENTLDKVTRSVNRLVIAIVTLGIYLASGVVLLAYSLYKGSSEIEFTMLILSLVGFGFAIFFTFSLIVSNWWSNR